MDELHYMRKGIIRHTSIQAAMWVLVADFSQLHSDNHEQKAEGKSESWWDGSVCKGTLCQVWYLSLITGTHMVEEEN